VSKDKLVEALSTLLADSYTLYLKTHNFHWNVTGPMFSTLHNQFETQYLDLATAVDEIAERIRAVGAPAPGSYAAFSKRTHIQESESVPKATDMVKQLADDQDTLAKTASAVLEAAQAIDDEVSADMAIARMQVHEKTAWMLRSHLG